MPYFVIKKDCASQVYDNEDFEVEILEFKTHLEAENYLNGIKPVCENKIDKNIKVFTDGACNNNGKPNARAGIGIFFGHGDKRNVSRRIKGKQSNNTAELSAIIEVFNILKNEIESGYNITIYTDSEYCIKCCGSYGFKCSQQNWKNRKGLIPNQELVKEAYEKKLKNKNVSLKFIKAHTGFVDELSIGNDGADRLANLSIKENRSIINSKYNEPFVYLNCPYDKKELAKELGAKWDIDHKKWYYERGKICIENSQRLNEMFG